MSDESELQILTQRAEKPNFLTQTRFDELNLLPEVLAGLQDAGLTYCTPIQAHVLPVSLTGRDVAGQAQTGTGKTAVFLVTVFTKLLALPKRKTNLPSALIVAPTRELALQIYEDAMVLGSHTGLSLAQVVGGIDYHKQMENLKHESVDVIVATPGRLIDFKNTVLFLTSNLATDVLTEMTKSPERPPDDVILSAVRPLLSQHFKPALLARMSVVPFYTLPADAMKGIVRLKLGKLAKRLLENNKMKLVYTDGVVEARNASGEEFHTLRLESYLDGCRDAAAADVVRGLVGRVEDFAGDTPQYDDVTVLVLRVLGLGG